MSEAEKARAKKPPILRIPLLALAVAAFFLAADDAPSDPPKDAVEALRAGREAFSAGDFAAAQAAYGEARERFPIVADHAERLRIGAALAAEEFEEVASAAQAFTRKHRDSTVAAWVWADLAVAQAALERPVEARAAWKEAARMTQDAEERAEWTVARAHSLETEGQAAEAAALWLDLWRKESGTPAARLADGRLLALESRLGRPLRTAEDWAERAKNLGAAFRNEPALEACERALAHAEGLSAATQKRLREQRAQLFFRLRRYPEATEAYAGLGSAPEHRLYHARSLARSGKIQEAIDGFRVVAGQARTRVGARALFLAGTLLDDLDPEAARKAFETVANRAPTRDARAEARWRMGWAAYRAGAWKEAVQQLALVKTHTPDPIDQLRARYWWARSMENAGGGPPDASAPASKAQRALTQIAEDFPYTYYGWRARNHLGLPRPELAPEASPSTPGLGLPKVRWQRAVILVEAGILDGARRELENLLPRARRRADRVRLGELLARAGEHHRAERLMLDHDLLALAQGPRSKIGRRPFELAWPRAFSEFLEPAARRHGAPPVLVYSVMREESGFRPKVMSVVGARGLTQIMPETGERLSRELGRDDFDPEALLEASNNLDLGAFYLRKLLDRMEGRDSAAIASYNAGPNAVSRWVRDRGGLDDDVWVESIPYLQTRRYAKRVLRSMEVYRALYPELVIEEPENASTKQARVQ